MVPPSSAETAEPMFTISGYAYAGGGRMVTRVEISLDCGWTWTLADRVHHERPNIYGKYWCWCFYSIDVPLRAVANPVRLILYIV